MATMRIAVLRERGRFTIEETVVPVPGPGEVLVRVVGSGICASELETWATDADLAEPLYLGHEVSGIVAELGDGVDNLAVGDPVGVWVTSHGYAEAVVVKAAYCRSAGHVPLDLALAEPLSCAANAVEAADVRLGDDVVLIGAGFMGNLVHQLAALRGTRNLVVADARPDALDRAAALGATRVVDVTQESLADVVGELTNGRGADVTFECTGTQGALASVGDVTRMSGTITIVGFHQGDSRKIPLAYWNWMAFRIVNAHFREVTTIMRGMTVGMRLLAAGSLSMAPLVTHRYSLDDINDGFSALRDKPPGFAKATVVFEPTM